VDQGTATKRLKAYLNGQTSGPPLDGSKVGSLLCDCWNVRDLAKRAHISANTVVRFENEQHEPNATTVIGIKQAFEATGVRFSEDGGVLPPEKKSS
jgi:transcriptional regulator with XRE-family HTH domain